MGKGYLATERPPATRDAGSVQCESGLVELNLTTAPGN